MPDPHDTLGRASRSLRGEADVLEAGSYNDVYHRRLAARLREIADRVDAGRPEPFGLIWRPKPDSRRWQHRMAREGRAYPKAAEFVDVYRFRPREPVVAESEEQK
jgi:hypothetical protein